MSVAVRCSILHVCVCASLRVHLCVRGMQCFWNANDRLASEAFSSFSQFPTGNAIQSRAAFCPSDPRPSEYTHGSDPKTVSSTLPTPARPLPHLAFQISSTISFFLSSFFPYNARLSSFSSGERWLGAALTYGVTALSSVSSIGRKTTPKTDLLKLESAEFPSMKWTFQPSVISIRDAIKNPCRAAQCSRFMCLAADCSERNLIFPSCKMQTFRTAPPFLAMP